VTGTLAVAHGALLQAVGVLPAAAEPSPSPSTVEVPSADQTSPGLLGFLVTFGVAAAVILLAFSLVRHLRVVDRNARRLEAEGGAPASGGPASGAPASGGPVPGTPAPGSTARPAVAPDDDTPRADRPGESGTPPRDRP
jgi:hypothetical protein